VGAEDAEELLLDALAVAAKMLYDFEERGKKVIFRQDRCHKCRNPVVGFGVRFGVSQEWR